MTPPESGSTFLTRPVMLWPAAALGIAAISCASLLIRLADAPAPTIAAYRVTLAALFVAPRFFYQASRVPRAPRRSDLFLAFLSGVFLALHFLFWIQSLQKTTVAISVTLVSTTPLFTGLFGMVFLKERPHRLFWLGTLASIAGMAVVGGSGGHAGSRSLEGAVLAFAGAFMAAGYFLCGRRLRQEMDLVSYIFAAYGSSAVVLLAGCLATSTPLTGFSSKTYLVLVLLALVSQVIGHTTFNWVLRFLSASTVAILTLGEPVGATILAYLFLDETVAPLTGLGLVMVAWGIFLGSTASAGPSSRST